MEKASIGASDQMSGTYVSDGVKSLQVMESIFVNTSDEGEGSVWEGSRSWRIPPLDVKISRELGISGFMRVPSFRTRCISP